MRHGRYEIHSSTYYYVALCMRKLSFIAFRVNSRNRYNLIVYVIHMLFHVEFGSQLPYGLMTVQYEEGYVGKVRDKCLLGR